MSWLMSSAGQMAISAVMGYIMKYYAEKRKEENHRMELLTMNMKAKDTSMMKAAKRTEPWFRQLVSFILIVGLGSALIWAAWADVPVVLERTEEGRRILGIFKGKSETVYETVNGLVVLPEYRQAMLNVVCFMFGSSRAA